ncbi:MAG: Type 1 glutamine amidotransferase-like domain-containing protein [Candidatus Diapherotrites archaeon]|nr:Type 1 glutamine amidotransferase-like domain-containing protein [Candidatus Diapherotrites archaeon]
MKFFLASSASNVLNEIKPLLTKPCNKCIAAFIPTAANMEKNKWFQTADKQKLRSMGIKVFDVGLKNKTQRELSNELKKVDIVVVGGGNAFYLLEHANKSGFKRVLKEMPEETIYVGSSAGSVITAPNIEPIKTLDDSSKANLTSFEGLNLVGFLTLPHLNKQKYKIEISSIIRNYSKK